MTLYSHVFRFEDGRLSEAPLDSWRRTPDSQPAVSLRFVPSRVRPGESYRVESPIWAEETLDLAFDVRLRRSASSAVFRNWCTLDDSGQATLTTPFEHPAATLVIRRVRTQRSPWLPAVGAIEVVR